MLDLAIPTEATEITGPWLTAVLRRAGFDSTIVEVRTEPVGTGQMARSERVWLTSEPAGSAPSTLVVKFASADPTSRTAGSSGGYRNEVGFYRDLAGDLSLSTPRCYHAALSADGAEFVLVLADMAPARQGDQIAGCTVEQAGVAVDNLVGLHAPRWCDPTLREVPWIMGRSPEAAEFLGAILVDDTERFVDRYRDRLAADDVGVLTRFAAASARWCAARADRFSILHGDYRLDNLLFDRTETGEPTVSAVDWQTVAVDLPAKDVAYLLGNGLLTADRRLHERSLVERYHAGLVDAGVDGYSVDECWDDYVFGQFHGLVVTVLGAMHVVQTDRGDDMFMVMAERHCAAIVDLGSEALLPA